MPTTTIKKKRRQDPKLVAAKQKSEINYIAKTFKIPVKVVREVVKHIGRSRVKVYVELRLQGYNIPTRKYPKKK